MVELGCQPFPPPKPSHHGLSIEVQFQEYVDVDEPGLMLRRRTTGRVRVVLTGDGPQLQPYMDAIGALYAKERAC